MKHFKQKIKYSHIDAFFTYFSVFLAFIDTVCLSSWLLIALSCLFPSVNS